MLETLDAGANWRRNSSAFHADQHAIAWDPASAGRVYLGNDGGVYRSSPTGRSPAPGPRRTSQPFNQFYTVAVSRQDISRVLRRRPGQRLAAQLGATAWNSINGGDGTTNLIDPTNQNKVYTVRSTACAAGRPPAAEPVQLRTTTSDRAAGSRRSCRPEQPGDHVLRRQPAEPVHELGRGLRR